MTRAVVLLSGGLDSTVVATMAVKQFGAKNIIGLSMLYGQKHLNAETQAAERVARFLDVEFHRVHIAGGPMRGLGSSLVDGEPMPHMTYQELSEAQGVSPTYVPFRNAILISNAVAAAMSNGYDVVMIGVHAEDARNWAYPDCTPEFVGAMANAVYVGTYHQVRLLAPLQYMLKSDIVRVGHELGAPFKLTWSCYEGRGAACGKCPTCVERIHAFQANGLVDPIYYEE